jgi:glycosyltransferase involved in cell wall biosynthesis
MKIAFVYDWLTTQYGGAEQVLLALHEFFPDAPLFTSVYDPRQATWAQEFQVKTSWLQKIPGLKNNHRLLGLFLPLAFEGLDLSDFDVVISITSFAAKGIITKTDQLHVCYLLTPPRYLYSHQHEYLGKWEKIPILNQIVRWSLNYLRWWDLAAASRPDVIIPISNLVANRVKKYYGRECSPVIYPPVTLPQPSSQLESRISNLDNYYLIISRLVSYKKINLAIQACNQLGRNLIIVGDGPEKKSLEKLASKKIKLLGSVPNSQLQNLYNGCVALIMPGEEDFGITGLEALAYGKPVVVYHQSGVAEIIKNRQHGVHLIAQSVNSLIKAIEQLEATKFIKADLMKQAEKFSTYHFQYQFKQFINQATK